MKSVKMRAEIEKWPLRTAFCISGYRFEEIEVVLVTLEQSGQTGRGEAAGVYYRNDNPASMLKQLEAVRVRVEANITRQSLQDLLPAGGARNALDCALWDLEAKIGAQPAWNMAQIEKPRPLITTFTCGADRPDKMAAAAVAYAGARAIKLKLTGEHDDAERVRAVRDARRDVWLGVDANQGFTRASLERLMPVLVAANVDLIEQPFAVGQEDLLDNLQSPIPIAADESAQTAADVMGLVGRVNVVNIKLDKCGGLTAGLAMARAAHEAGLDTMVGNMLGTSLAMAPAFLVGQSCKIVDLDGPVFLKTDRALTVDYADGQIWCPTSLWGASDDSAVNV